MARLELYQEAGGDTDSILSMEVPSTGPPSLSLAGMGSDVADNILPLTLTWGIDTNTDLSSSDEEEDQA